MTVVFKIDRMTACPQVGENWFLIDFCPLYLESHWIREGKSRHMGCVDDVQKPCRVKRKLMDFEKAVAKIRALDPDAITLLEFRVAAELARAQQQRNMRALGMT